MQYKIPTSQDFYPINPFSISPSITALPGKASSVFKNLARCLYRDGHWEKTQPCWMVSSIVNERLYVSITMPLDSGMFSQKILSSTFVGEDFITSLSPPQIVQSFIFLLIIGSWSWLTLSLEKRNNQKRTSIFSLDF